jgi:hypothetical protein
MPGDELQLLGSRDGDAEGEPAHAGSEPRHDSSLDELLEQLPLEVINVRPLRQDLFDGQGVEAGQLGIGG